MEPFGDTRMKISFPKEPRIGQWNAIEECEKRSMLNVKLPTGYGKTLTACYIYRVKKEQDKVNRLLVIFPTHYQLKQFERDGECDLKNAGIAGPFKTVDIRFAGARSLKDHHNNAAQVFVITIQSLIEAEGYKNVTELLKSGKWMIVVDEYHHYGLDRTWGRVVLSLNRAFLLAMSATPTRPNDDSAFGLPHVSVKYREAVAEGAVKPLIGHAYSYRVEATNAETMQTEIYTTEQLVKEAGGDTPDNIERLVIERKMRWSPRYVSPLISVPIERMLNHRVATGQFSQVHITGMCVSHAKYRTPSWSVVKLLRCIPNCALIGSARE
jgi:superfamily II DNA or RNA helicase